MVLSYTYILERALYDSMLALVVKDLQAIKDIAER